MWRRRWGAGGFNELVSSLPLPFLTGITFTTYNRSWRHIVSSLISANEKRLSSRNPYGNLSFHHTWPVDTWKRMPRFKKQVDQSRLKAIASCIDFFVFYLKWAENKFPSAARVRKTRNKHAATALLTERFLPQGFTRISSDCQKVNTGFISWIRVHVRIVQEVLSQLNLE